jgi:dihydroorotate dehydrogenase electron transfer subunit
VAPPTEAWMVAGGVGLAPFVTLAEAIRATGGRARLFYGARRASELYYVDLFERMGVEVVLSTEDGSRGHKGYVTAPLDRALGAVSDPANIHLYVCGPTPMMRAVADLAASYRTPCDVSLEQVMGCGLGGCYSCVVLAQDATGVPHFIRSCIEGPVFDATRIVWNALAH